MGLILSQFNLRIVKVYFIKNNFNLISVFLSVFNHKISYYYFLYTCCLSASVTLDFILSTAGETLKNGEVTIAHLPQLLC